jgi:predicted nucleotidyltransferase
MTKAFGPPQLLASALAEVGGIDRAFLYGSWAARNAGETGARQVGDIGVMVLGEPDREALFAATSGLESRLGRPVQVTIRSARWLEEGSGSFHDTVTERPLLELSLDQAPLIS